MSTRIYPLYQRGNPQLRIFLPNFWMKLIKQDTYLRTAPNVAHFQVSPEMTRVDVKNYLEQIYKLPVVNVKTINLAGEALLVGKYTKNLTFKIILILKLQQGSLLEKLIS